jgi:uncharacterized protein
MPIPQHSRNTVVMLANFHDNCNANIATGKKRKMITIAASIFGKGLFAIMPIEKGRVVMNITGKRINFDQAVILGEKESYPFQVGLKEYIAPETDAHWQYINHSCDPNCGVNQHLELVALRDIEIGEEIFYDYSTSMLERHWTMKCHCHSANCRHIISDFDSLGEERQKYYVNLGVVQQFITNYLNKDA